MMRSRPRPESQSPAASPHTQFRKMRSNNDDSHDEFMLSSSPRGQRQRRLKANHVSSDDDDNDIRGRNNSKTSKTMIRNGDNGGSLSPRSRPLWLKSDEIDDFHSKRRPQRSPKQSMIHGDDNDEFVRSSNTKNRPRNSRVVDDDMDEFHRTRDKPRRRRSNAETMGNATSIHRDNDDDDYDEFLAANKPRRRLKAETLDHATSIHDGDDDDDDPEDFRTSRRRRLKAETLGNVTSIHGGDDDEQEEFRSTSRGRRRLQAESLGNVTSIHGGDDNVDEFALLSKRKSPRKKLQAEILSDEVTSIHSSSFEAADSSNKRAEILDDQVTSIHSVTSVDQKSQKSSTTKGSGQWIHGEDNDDEEHNELRNVFNNMRGRNKKAAAAARTRNGDKKEDTSTDDMIRIRYKLVDIINDLDLLLLSFKNNRRLRPVRSKLVEAFDEIGLAMQQQVDITNQQEKLVDPISKKLARALNDLESLR